MAWIYQITNKKNGKIYIGYTKCTPEHRFEEHWRCRFCDDSILHRAMKKYGKNSFEVKGIEQISEEQWVEKEQQWIEKKKSFSPKGYNICLGGNKPPAHYGSDNTKSKLTTIDFNNLVKDLSEYELDFSQIAAKYGISQSQVERINKGESREIEGQTYPIRKMKKDLYIIQQILQDLKEGELDQTEIEEKYKIKSRTRLHYINIGRVGKKFFPQQKYPVRQGIVCRKPLWLKKVL